ncbi:ubiquinol-cytochrome c reductase iron-sulfur subunit [Actinomadura alba]|uniref:Cytochrome bc1 complex Rieske iron-sulfur subunit n=1 Tax=Actinomadura alba TaxID=406431 RepID=A0ABR7LKL1_9ACTN|nr:Rieske 2Fe-2S domain-containing protein [Actinomadura alba]MBC6465379.1 Rieske (2Fe-2S) protein [Actinomadura alba]
MTDNNEIEGSQEPKATGGTDGGEGRAPKRVIGTPPPAGERQLIASDEGPPADRPGVEFDERSARKAERVVATFFLLAFLGSLAFIVYFIGFSGRDGGMHGIHRARESNYALGSAMTVAFLGIAMGVTVWVRRVMTTQPLVQQRSELATPPEEKQGFTDSFLQGAEETGLTKRPLLRRTLLLAVAPLGLAPLLLLRDLGPLPEKRLRHTFWGEAAKAAQRSGKKGVRLLVDGTETPLKASDFNSPGGIITVIPEGVEKTHEPLNEIAKAAVLLINIPADKFKPVKGRENWHINGIVAYSKICTHVGCPAALYEQTTHHILCPCHQSTFDATNGAKVLFGPAARPLPQLPISVDDEGYLVATADFPEPIGPSFWERG